MKNFLVNKENNIKNRFLKASIGWIKYKPLLLYIKDKVVLLLGINPILIYGGSVNENTIEKLKHVNLIDGYLIGSASLNINSLETIIEVVK